MTEGKARERKSGTESAAADAFQPILEAPAERPFVVAQLGQSLDGRIAPGSRATSMDLRRWITCTGCAQRWTRWWSERAPSSPTIRS